MEWQSHLIEVGFAAGETDDVVTDSEMSIIIFLKRENEKFLKGSA